MSALNNDGVSRLVVSLIVAKTIYDLRIEDIGLSDLFYEFPIRSTNS